MLYLFIFTQLILVILLIFLANQFFNLFFRGYAPFLTTRQEVIDKIIANVKLNNSSVFYELGAGEAPILRALEKKFKTGKLIGLEYSFLPFLSGKIQLALSNSRIKFYKKNIWRQNYNDATHIYLYLNPEMMEKLQSKFKKELKKGALVISFKYPFSSLKPNKIINDQKDNIYFYQF